MDTRTTLYSQISEFENVIDSFNDIHACLGNGEIEIHEEVAAIKEKLAISMQKDNIDPPVVETHTHEEREKTAHSYWNNRRICSANGGLPPMVKRQQYYESLQTAA